jgi:hypothetical protein
MNIRHFFTKKMTEYDTIVDLICALKFEEEQVSLINHSLKLIDSQVISAFLEFSANL